MEEILIFLGLVALAVWAIRSRRRRKQQRRQSYPPVSRAQMAPPPAPRAQPPSLLPGGNKALLGVAAAAGAYMLGRKHAEASDAGSGSDLPITSAQEQMLTDLLQSQGITLDRAAAAAGVELGARGLTRREASQIIASLGGV